MTLKKINDFRGIQRLQRSVIYREMLTKNCDISQQNITKN